MFSLPDLVVKMDSLTKSQVSEICHFGCSNFNWSNMRVRYAMSTINRLKS